MAITDERTPQFNLPLPVKTNALKDDVERLREGLILLDQLIVSATKLSSEGGSELIFGLGNIIGTTSEILASTKNPQAYQTNGFYAQNDGGEGVWKFTGNTDASKAGTHAITKGMIYNANGNEYALDISSGKVSVLANGAKAYTYAQCVDQTTDNFVCVGQAHNGITSLLPPAVSTSNNTATYQGGKRLSITCPSNIWRIGKEHIKLVSGVDYRWDGARFMVYAGLSYTYAATGKKLNGACHGYDEIKEKWEAVGRQSYWGSVSAQNINIYGGIFYGDHAINKQANDCSAGVAILVLNPEYVNLYGVYTRGFTWDAVGIPAQLAETNYKTVYGNKFDDNEKDYRYVLDYMVEAGVTSRFGNFYGFNCTNCQFSGGRRGTYRNGSDWSHFTGGKITQELAWQTPGNVSGDVPQYIGVITGTGFHCSGAYTSPAAAKGYNPSESVFYTSARNHVFTGLYTEWAYNLFTISAFTFVGAASRLQGLHIDCVSTYKDDFMNYNQVKFEQGCFGTVDDAGNYIYPAGFAHFDLPNGATCWSWGTPVRDLGAFRHGGFDTKFGPYNMYMTAGTDWESWRDRPYAKEMFNAYGLQINSGTVFLPWQTPAIKSMACIWIKDLTGNFDPRNVVAWQTAASQDGSNSDEALYKSFGEKMFDYNNGYKMIMVAQKRLSAHDGLYSYARNPNIVITVPPETPIVIKAVEAYTGGIPMFPNGCANYEPESPCTSVLSTVSNQVGQDSSLGGGLFLNGDVIAPWVHKRRTQTGYRITPSLTAGYGVTKRMVTGGVTLESAYKVAFSATIDSVDSTKGLTTITVPSAQLPYVAVGIPLYVTGGSSTSTTGQVHLLKRLMNADGTATAKYVVMGVIGAAGDTLTIDQAQLPAYSFYSDYSVNTLTATSVTINGVGTANAFRGTASLGIGYNASAGVKPLEFFFNGGTTPSHRLVASSASGMVLEAGGNFSVVGHIFPSADNAYSLGLVTNRATQVFATNSTIATSNKIKKRGIRQSTDVENDAFYEIGQLDSVWQWLEKYEAEGDDARLHSGPTVQDAIEIMDKYGLDWTQYSAFCYDKWDARDAVIETWDAEYETIPGTDAEYNEAGELTAEAVPEVQVLVREAGSKVVKAAREAGEDYAFRKEELLFWISRATIAKQTQIEERLAALEAKLAS